MERRAREVFRPRFTAPEAGIVTGHAPLDLLSYDRVLEPLRRPT